MGSAGAHARSDHPPPRTLALTRTFLWSIDLVVTEASQSQLIYRILKC